MRDGGPQPMFSAQALRRESRCPAGRSCGGRRPAGCARPALQEGDMRLGSSRSPLAAEAPTARATLRRLGWPKASPALVYKRKGAGRSPAVAPGRRSTTAARSAEGERPWRRGSSAREARLPCAARARYPRARRTKAPSPPRVARKAPLRPCDGEPRWPQSSRGKANGPVA